MTSAASRRAEFASRAISKSSRSITEFRVIQLVGALTFATLDYVSRRVGDKESQILIIDFRRVASITQAADCCWPKFCAALPPRATAILAEIEPASLISAISAAHCRGRRSARILVA